MQAIAGPIGLILDVAFFIMIIHIIMSWLISFQVLNLHQQFVAQIWYGLNRLLEPIYAPIRRLMPNTGPLDLSPLVAFIILISLRDFILPEILCGGRPLGFCG
ncbi:MAG: YggT family protein [Pseudomonadota bacterium]